MYTVYKGCLESIQQYNMKNRGMDSWTFSGQCSYITIKFKNTESKKSNKARNDWPPTLQIEAISASFSKLTLAVNHILFTLILTPHKLHK